MQIINFLRVIIVRKFTALFYKLSLTSENYKRKDKIKTEMYLHVVIRENIMETKLKKY